MHISLSLFVRWFLRSDHACSEEVVQKGAELLYRKMRGGGGQSSLVLLEGCSVFALFVSGVFFRAEGVRTEELVYGTQ